MKVTHSMYLCTRDSARCCELWSSELRSVCWRFRGPCTRAACHGLKGLDITQGRWLLGGDFSLQSLIDGESSAMTIGDDYGRVAGPIFRTESSQTAATFDHVTAMSIAR